jgi:hypothetical protein
MDTVLSYVLRNKPDLGNSGLLGCYTVIKKKKAVPVHEGKQREHKEVQLHSLLPEIAVTNQSAHFWEEKNILSLL